MGGVFLTLNQALGIINVFDSFRNSIRATRRRGQGTSSEFDSTGDGPVALPVHRSNPQRQSWNADRLGLRSGDVRQLHRLCPGSEYATLDP